ncbi:MAG: ABC transporter ATP-binding protein [Spirochaetia bacterium]
MEADLRFENLSFGYSSITVLKNITLSLPKNAFTAFIGPNGSGKTTLLKTASGLLTPSSGSVTLSEGHSPHRMKAKHRAQRIGYLPQSEESFPGFTVSDVILSGRYCRTGSFGQYSQADKRLCREKAEIAGIIHLLDKDYSCLSAGEKQLVRFVRVLCQEAETLLLDEASANLDMRHEHQIYSLCRDFVTSGGTVAAALHDLQYAYQYAHYMLLFFPDKTVLFDIPERIITKENLEKAFQVKVEIEFLNNRGVLINTSL